jgi:DNA-binding transcriptional ArsR family regulator
MSVEERAVAHEPNAVTEMFKALGDPIRWSILQQIAAEEEFACSALEDTLPVSKPTISYHTKILTQAGLIEVHKRGRNYYYRLREEALGTLIEEIQRLAPRLRLVSEPVSARKPARRTKPRGEVTALRKAVGDDTARPDEPTPPPTVLTW